MSEFLGKVLGACSGLNHHTCTSRLVRMPSIPLSFNLAVVSRRECLNALAAALRGGNPLTLSTHRLRRGLPGYLILFDPHAFAHQRQLQTRKSPSPLVFLLLIYLCAFRYINPSFALQFPFPYRPPRLSRGLSHQTKEPYARFTR